MIHHDYIKNTLARNLQFSQELHQELRADENVIECMIPNNNMKE